MQELLVFLLFVWASIFVARKIWTNLKLVTKKERDSFVFYQFIIDRTRFFGQLPSETVFGMLKLNKRVMALTQGDSNLFDLEWLEALQHLEGFDEEVIRNYYKFFPKIGDPRYKDLKSSFLKYGNLPEMF